MQSCSFDSFDPDSSVLEPEHAVTATCSLSGIGTVMKIGSGSGSNIKCNTKVKKSKLRGHLSGKQCCFLARFCTHFLLLKTCAK